MELNLVVLSLARQMYVLDSLVSQTFVIWEMSFLTYKWCMWRGGTTDTFLHHESGGQRTKKAFLWIWMKPVSIECAGIVPRKCIALAVLCKYLKTTVCLHLSEKQPNVCTNFNSSVSSKDKSSVMIFRAQKNVGIMWGVWTLTCCGGWKRTTKCFFF